MNPLDPFQAKMEAYYNRIDEKEALNELTKAKIFLKYSPHKVDAGPTKLDDARKVYEANERNTSLFWKIFNKIIPFKTNRDKIQDLFKKIEVYDTERSPLNGRASQQEKVTLDRARALGFLGNDVNKASVFLNKLVLAYVDFQKKRGSLNPELLSNTFFGSKVDKEKVLTHLEDFALDHEQIAFILDREDIRYRNVLIDYLARKPFRDPIDFKYVKKGIETNNKHLLNLSVKSGVDFYRVQEGTTPLHLAVSMNQPDIVRFILAQDVLLGKLDEKSKMTAAELAWVEARVEIFNLLIEEGAIFRFNLMELPLKEDRFFNGDFLTISKDTILPNHYDEMIRSLIKDKKSDLTIDIKKINPLLKPSLDRLIREAILEDDGAFLQALVEKGYPKELLKTIFDNNKGSKNLNIYEAFPNWK